MMTIEFVSISGACIDVDRLPKAPKRKAAAADIEDRGYHRGWVVEGHRPGAKDDAQKMAGKRLSDWSSP